MRVAGLVGRHIRRSFAADLALRGTVQLGALTRALGPCVSACSFCALSFQRGALGRGRRTPHGTPCALRALASDTATRIVLGTVV